MTSDGAPDGTGLAIVGVGLVAGLLLALAVLFLAGRWLLRRLR